MTQAYAKVMFSEAAKRYQEQHGSQAQYERLAKFKRERGQAAWQAGLDGLARSTRDASLNIYEAVLDAIRAGATHGEVCGTLRKELGFGQPLVRL